MTQIVLEIDNDKDTRLFLDLAERLNVKFKFDDNIKINDSIDENQRKEKMRTLGQFKGKLKDYKGYEPAKSEFYEQ
ncbi:MAG: hypothetical protein ACK4YV_11440 [Emticicia sp.]